MVPLEAGAPPKAEAPLEGEDPAGQVNSKKQVSILNQSVALPWETAEATVVPDKVATLLDPDPDPDMDSKQDDEGYEDVPPLLTRVPDDDDLHPMTDHNPDNDDNSSDENDASISPESLDSADVLHGFDLSSTYNSSASYKTASTAVSVARPDFARQAQRESDQPSERVFVLPTET